MEELEICRMSALKLRHAIRSKKLSPVEIVDAVLARINRINPKINAYCTLVPEMALAAAKNRSAR